jgi:hypothetical protein
MKYGAPAVAMLLVNGAGELATLMVVEVTAETTPVKIGAAVRGMLRQVVFPTGRFSCMTPPGTVETATEVWAKAEAELSRIPKVTRK